MTDTKWNEAELSASPKGTSEPSRSTTASAKLKPMAIAKNSFTCGSASDYMRCGMKAEMYSTNWRAEIAMKIVETTRSSRCPAYRQIELSCVEEPAVATVVRP